MRARVTGNRALLTGLLTAVLAILPAASASAQVGLRVLTWNVQGGTAGDGREPDMDTLSAVLAEARPRVVGLQEICRETVHEPEFLELLHEMGYSRPIHAHGVDARVRRDDDGEEFACDYGTALLVRGRVTKVWKRELFPRDANGRPERRNVACARTRLGERRLWFCNTHVARQGDRDRGDRPITDRQIKSLARRMRDLNGPVVLVGDLNRRPRRDSPLAAQFDEIDPENRPTLNNEKLDYILFTPGDFRRDGVAFLEPSLIGTDHFGMFGRLRLR
jgi:endonuclease/exonuclease/phosphatase family metal-dependent hydrolase